MNNVVKLCRTIHSAHPLVLTYTPRTTPDLNPRDLAQPENNPWGSSGCESWEGIWQYLHLCGFALSYRRNPRVLLGSSERAYLDCRSVFKQRARHASVVPP